MKTTFLTFVLLITATTVFTQSTPQPPQPPSLSYQNNKMILNKSYSVSTKRDKKVENLSISTSNSDTSYKFRARFGKTKTSQVKEIILVRLADEKLKVNGTTYEWIKKENENKVFECRLSKGNLRIYVDKEEVSTHFAKKIERLGKELREIISGRSTKQYRESEIKRAEHALEQAKRNLESVKNIN